MRDRIEPRVLLLEAAVVIYSFMAAAFRSDWPSVTEDPAALVRLLIPVIAAMGGLLLRDAFADRANRPPHATAVDVIVAYGLAALTEVVLFALKPSLALPRWAPTQGGFVGMVLLALTRALFATPADGPAANPTSELEAVWREAELRTKIAHTRRAYLGAWIILSLTAAYFLFSGSMKTRIASGWILGGTLYALAQRRAPSGSYCAELESEHTSLRRVAWWYYGSLLPGITLALVGYPVYPYWLPLMVLIAAEWNQREMGRLAQESDEAGAVRLVVRRLGLRRLL
jgi:hypothetical protein